MKCGATEASRRARRSRGAGCAGRASCPAASGRGDWERKARVDWKEKLAPEVFERFARLRERRKAIAAEDCVPPYMVMTDAQMAEAASAEELTPTVLGKIDGFGAARVEKYGKRLVEGTSAWKVDC